MKTLSVIGTRPDAIKLLPVHTALKEAGIQSVLCGTFQHIKMLEQVLSLFEVEPDYNLNIMEENQDLFHITNTVLEKIKPIFIKEQPDIVIVQGDTTTAFAAALAAFYLKIPVAHVEAGLRTGNLNAPFPEEMNRKFIGMIASYHFAPTSLNVANLLHEGVSRNSIILTGNTVVDALYSILDKIKRTPTLASQEISSLTQNIKNRGNRLVLFTAHRRESFGMGIINILNSLKQAATIYPHIEFVYPHHPNPHIQKALQEVDVTTTNNIHLLQPLNYLDLIYCLKEASWVATDSGGIQEEAISLGKPTIILRDTTERIEGVWEGIAFLTGTSSKAILNAIESIEREKPRHSRSNIYGDGQASKKIASFLGAIRGKSHPVTNTLAMPVEQQLYYANINPRNPRREA